MSKSIDNADLIRIAGKIKITHGYDFLNYAQPSFRRRVQRVLELKKLTVTDLLQKIEEHPAFITELLHELTVNVTEMFRDPNFWSLLRKKILPSFTKKENKIRIWHAGCSTGEEVFSMAILLAETGIYQHADILATDIDDTLLQKARTGIYPAKSMELNNRNYRESGGLRHLGAFSRTDRDKVLFDTALLANVTFEKHDLVTGRMDRYFDLILCRNVMIYFNQDLQNQVLKKFHKSLASEGYLALGAKESLAWHEVTAKFAQEDRTVKVYRKIAH